MTGVQRVDQLKAAGFGDAEIDQWSAQKRKELGDAGFNETEINAWFGQKEFNPAPVETHFDDVMKTAVAANKNEQGETTKDFTWTDAFKAGWQGSSTGLAVRGQMPDTVLPEDAAWYERWASGAAGIAGDLPAGVAGFIVGLGGGAPTGPGALVTGTAGAFALPAALRATLTDAYKNGEFKTPKEFLERAAGIFLETGKGYVTGAATGLAGVGASAAVAGASKVAQVVVPTAAELTAMVTTSKALEGQLPSAQDFIDGALLLGGAKLAVKGGSVLHDIYAQTGKTPAQVVQDAQIDPTIKQDVAAGKVPTAYENMVDPMFKKEEPAPAAPAPTVTPLSDAEAAILSKIEIGGKVQKEGYSWDKFYTDAVDDLNPIKKAVDEMTGGEKLIPSQDPYALARLTKGTFGKAEQFINYSPFDYATYKNVGKPLAKIVEPFKKDLNGLRAYVVAKRAVELEGRGIKSGFDLAEATSVTTSGAKKYEKAAQELVDYQNHVTKYLKDSGVLSDDAYKAMLEANKAYVPFYRVLETENAPAGKGLTVKNPIKAIKGSSKDVIDPVESIIKNTYAYITLAERNAAAGKFIELAESSDAGAAFARKVDAPIRPVSVADKEMTRFLKSEGIDSVPENALTVFRAVRQPLAENEIAVFRKGKREVYELNPEVAAAFKATDKENLNTWFKLLAGPTKLFRAGVTLSPDFMPRNLVRDQFDAFVNSKNGFVPMISSVSGLVSLGLKDEHYQNWLKSGGANATFVSMDRRYIQGAVSKMEGGRSLKEYIKDELAQPYGNIKLPWNLVTFIPGKGVDALRVASELAENMTRLGEFKRATKKLGTDKAALQDAGLQSREITLDFARAGAKGRAFNQITAFFNAQLQGVDRIGRRINEDPVTAMAKITAAVTLPSVLLWLAQNDDPRWKEIPDWQKDNFWIILTDDNIYRIPKPHETGLIFGSGAERFLEYVKTQDPAALEAFAKNVLSAFAPSAVPTATLPIIEQFSNKSTFTGSPIIPADVEKLLPEYQYTAYTTELTKSLGALLGHVPYIGTTSGSIASPAIVENYIRQWTGGLGMYMIQIADKGLRDAGVLPDPVKPANTLADIPIIKAFVVRYPSGSAQSIQNFYDGYEETRRVYDTVRYKAKEGDFTAVQKLTAAHPDAMVKMDGIKDALGNMSKLIRAVWKNPEISAEEKRQIIDTTYYQMIETARLGNQLMRETKAALAK